MQRGAKRDFLFFIFLVSFLPFLSAENRRTIPLDLYLIIDDSEAFQNVKDNAIAWVNAQVLDRLLIEGDSVTVWTAGDTAKVLYSGEISTFEAKKDIQDMLKTTGTGGKTADFAGALRELEPILSQAPQNRMPYSVLVTASAVGLRYALAGKSQNLLRWFRTEKYERWQALIIAPDIGPKVSQAASAYMNSMR